MLKHQWASFNHAEFERADAKSAFPQGDGKEMQETANVFRESSALNRGCQEHPCGIRSATFESRVRTWECATEFV